MNQNNDSAGKRPVLRFREFDGEWESEPIDSYIELLSGYAFKGEDISEINVGFPLLRGINITEGVIRHSPEMDRYYSGNTSKLKKYFLKINDLVVGMDGSKVGKNVALITKKDENSLLIQRVARIRSIYKSDIRFIYQHIFSNQFHEYVDVVNTSSGIPHISAQQIKNFIIGFPSKEEQTKIANFLTAVDEKIQALKKKKVLLEQYKKGVMQKLFVSEAGFTELKDEQDIDESNPKILKSVKSRLRQVRITDENGNEFADWEVKKLGEVFTFKVTNSFSRENLNYEIGQVKNIHYGDIHTKFQTLFNVTKEDVPFINSDISIKRIAVENYCIEGDLILADASEDLNDVGKSIEIVNINNEEVLAGLHTILARPNPNTFSLGFTGYLFKSNIVRTQIQKEAQGSKVLSISATRLSNISLSIPILKEQTLIASFLSAIDDKIKHNDVQIQKTEIWKKGLLQKMFV